MDPDNQILKGMTRMTHAELVTECQRRGLNIEPLNVVPGARRKEHSRPEMMLLIAENVNLRTFPSPAVTKDTSAEDWVMTDGGAQASGDGRLIPSRKRVAEPEL